MSEHAVRQALEACARTGEDPVARLARLNLIRTEESVLRVRQDTLRAAADLIYELPPSSVPHQATLSAGDMKAFLSTFLRDLAGRQQ